MDEPNPTPAPEPTPAPDSDFKKLLDDLKTDFTAKLNAQRQDYEAKLKERDEYIKSLLTADNTPAATSVAERINAKRDFKKW